MRYAKHFLVLVVVGVGCYLAGSALGQAPANQPLPNSQVADFNVGYARVFRDLARIDYEKVVAANREVPGVISRDTLATLQLSLIYPESRYQLALDEAAGKPVDYTAYLQKYADAAEAHYQAQRNSMRSSQGEYRLELERLRLTAEMARLRVARAKQMKDAPEVERLSWRAQLQHEELVLLHEKVIRLLVQPAR
ncbi:MAG TPA: hypothetical protein VHZ24_03460 [Pirellulales bacterium]|jgi:hypothetical protein|nr:hypothetical protein [Pirellulales bacterium]